MRCDVGLLPQYYRPSGRDPADYLPTADDRQRADDIRRRVRIAGERRGVPADIIDGTVARRLREAGFGRFVSESEADGAETLDRRERVLC